ncbi:MAG: hypothetical protein K6F61_11765 [Clostridiales bacterium]|nr:hypothetical protein [Clostridiales bacterium]
MTGFKALLRLQLLSRFADFKPKNLKTALKEKKGRTIGMLIAILFLVVYLGVILYIVETKMLEFMIGMGAPEMLITMAVVLTTAGTLILSFFFTLSALYLGRDAAYLAALPLKPRTILSAKLVQVWVSETLIDAIILLPACILYAVKVGVDPGFYLRMIVVWLLIALMPICVIAFVASLLIRLSALWKHREVLLTVSGIALMVGYMFLMMNLGGITGDTADGGEMIRQLVESSSARIGAMTKMFPPAAWAADGMLGQNYGMFIVWILLSLAVPVITVWLLGYSYRKLSMLQTETPTGSKKKLTGKESFAAGTQLKACCLREIRTILRVPSYATNILPICFMPLLMVIMIVMVAGRTAGENSEGFKMIFQNLNPAIVMGILAAVMAYMGGMNPALSTAVTREGKGHDFMTALPVSAHTFVTAKFIVGFAMSMFGIIAAAVALGIYFQDFVLPIILACVLCLLFSFANAALALSRDVKKPRLDWVTEQEAVKQNFGVVISMLISWGILGLLALLTYFLITWGLEIVPVFLILAAILTALCFGAYMILRKTTEKYYCAG